MIKYYIICPSCSQIRDSKGLYPTNFFGMCIYFYPTNRIDGQDRLENREIKCQLEARKL